MSRFDELVRIINPETARDEYNLIIKNMSAMDEFDLQHSPLSPVNLFDEYEEDDDPCERCECKDESTCCGASIILHDICSNCGEHCDNWCDECEDNPKSK